MASFMIWSRILLRRYVMSGSSMTLIRSIRFTILRRDRFDRVGIAVWLTVSIRLRSVVNIWDLMAEHI